MIATHLLSLAVGMGLAWIISRQHLGQDAAAAHAEGAAGPPRQVAEMKTAPGSRGAAFSGVGSHRQAWEWLMKRPRGERERYLPELLEEWIQRDPAAALEAVLEMENHHELLSHFHGLFQQDPAGFRHLFAGEKFGLNTEKIRSWWIEQMAHSHPADLLGLAGEFGPLTVLSIGTQCVRQAEGSPEKRHLLIQAVSSLPESSANQQLVSSIARRLALSDDPQELLDRLIEIPGPLGAAMVGSAMAILLERTDLTGAKATFQSLPTELRKAAVDAVLEKPGRGISGYLAAIDEVIEGAAWSELKGPLALRLHEAAPQPDQYPALLAWAAQMPEREDTMDLYRVAVRSFVTREPEQARAWILGMEPGWKQQNSLAAYVQTALAARNDEAGAQWAYDQITDPVFKAEAQDFYRFHEERKQQR